MAIRHYNPVNQSPDATKGRMRLGVAPDPLQQPLTFARLVDSDDGSAWLLSWVRYNIGKPHQRLAQPTPMPADAWLNCKLHVDGRAMYKANYWVSMNPAEGRVASRWDKRSLTEHRPRLEAALTALAHYLKSIQDFDVAHMQPMYNVTAQGEGWLIHDTSAQGRWRAVLAELEALDVGGTRIYAMADLPLLKEAKAVMQPMAFSGVADALTGGILVTRTA